MSSNNKRNGNSGNSGPPDIRRGAKPLMWLFIFSMLGLVGLIVFGGVASWITTTFSGQSDNATRSTALPAYAVSATQSALHNSETATALQLKERDGQIQIQATAAAIGVGATATANVYQSQATAAALTATAQKQQIDYSRQQSDLQRDQANAPFWSIFWLFLAFGFVLVILAAIVLGGIGYLRRSIALADTIEVDSNGNYAGRWYQGQVVTTAPGNALPANVPANMHYAPVQTQTYAPHLVQQAQRGDAMGQLEAPATIIDAEAVTKVFEPLTAQTAASLLTRNQLAWCFGIDQDGQPVIMTVEDSTHILGTASTGIGKTTLAASMCYQLVSRNDPDIYRLVIMDIKGTLIRPFKPWAFATGKSSDEYLELIKKVRIEVDRRRENDIFNGVTLIVVIEEFLALKRYLQPDQLKEFSKELDIIALTGREYHVFLVGFAQVDYASKDFQNSRGQFLTRLAGAVIPTAATSLGFTNVEIIKVLWREKRKGRFLMEGPEGDKIIQAPILNIKIREHDKASELDDLLLAVPQPGGRGGGKSGVHVLAAPGGDGVTPHEFEPVAARLAAASTYTPSRPAATSTNRPGQTRPEFAIGDVKAVDMAAWTRELEAVTPAYLQSPEPTFPNEPEAEAEPTLHESSDLESRARAAWKDGANSVRKLAEALNVKKNQAEKLIRELNLVSDSI